jgi:hypothetical protein
MGGKAGPGPPKSAKRVALVRFRAADWPRWQATAADPERFAEPFEAWRAGAEAMARRLERAGLEVVWIDLDPDRIAAWCRSRGYANDNEKRFQYAAEQIGNVRIQ